jgi:hypothetical protein
MPYALDELRNELCASERVKRLLARAQSTPDTPNVQK